jgi:hypothetical protein
MNPRYKYVTDLNGEQMPMIIPQPDTAAYGAYAAGQHAALADKHRDDGLRAEERGRQSTVAPLGALTPNAVDRIRRAIEEQKD